MFAGLKGQTLSPACVDDDGAVRTGDDAPVGTAPLGPPTPRHGAGATHAGAGRAGDVGGIHAPSHAIDPGPRLSRVAGRSPDRPPLARPGPGQPLARRSRPRVSGNSSMPTTKQAAATSTGYHRPWYMLPWPATIANAMLGISPPNQPLPTW